MAWKTTFFRICGLAGADGHPDPDLRRLLGHGVGLDPIHPGQSQKQGQPRKEAHQDHDEPLTPNRLPHHVLHGGDIGEGNVRVQLCHQGPEGWDQGRGCSCSVDHQVRGPTRPKVG